MAKKSYGKRKSAGVSLIPYVYAVSILAVLFTLYIFYRIGLSEKRLISISIIALVSGAIYESKMLTGKWREVLLPGILAFLFSFVVFLPGKRESEYIFESHIASWPYAFVIIFILLMISFHKEKITPKLTEGITLIQSMATIYWIADYHFLNPDNGLIILFSILAIPLAVFSIYHALSYAELTQKHRLVLSVWSSVIMLLFAVDNIIRVYQNDDIENVRLISGIYIGLQYFLLGVSAVYMVQNFMMLSRFLPEKEKFFDAEYFKELKKLKKEHFDRFSESQVRIKHAAICIVLSGGLFFTNYSGRFVPSHVAIWFVFVVFQFLGMLSDYLFQRKRAGMVGPDNEITSPS